MDSNLCRSLETLHPSSTKPIFWKYERKCFQEACKGPSLEDRKSQICHAAANKMLWLRKFPHICVPVSLSVFIFFRCVSISISAKFTDWQSDRLTKRHFICLCMLLYDFLWLCMTLRDRDRARAIYKLFHTFANYFKLLTFFKQFKLSHMIQMFSNF